MSKIFGGGLIPEPPPLKYGPARSLRGPLQSDINVEKKQHVGSEQNFEYR